MSNFGHHILRIAACAALFIMIPADLCAHPSIDEYLSADSSHDVDAARKILRTLPQPSTYFPWALAENARLTYRDGEWASFFGVTLYARRFFPRAIETEKVRLLEVLALMRHCQWDEAKKVARESLSIQHTVWDAAVGFLAHGLSVASKLPADDRIKAVPKRRTTVLPYFGLWKTGKIDPRALPVDRLRRQIEPVCDNPAEENSRVQPR